jgi:hypothetical protein
MLFWVKYKFIYIIKGLFSGLLSAVFIKITFRLAWIKR